MAILNDSTGTLMSCAWLNHQCRIGCIVGEFLKNGALYLRDSGMRMHES